MRCIRSIYDAYVDYTCVSIFTIHNYADFLPILNSKARSKSIKITRLYTYYINNNAKHAFLYHDDKSSTAGSYRSGEIPRQRCGDRTRRTTTVPRNSCERFERHEPEPEPEHPSTTSITRLTRTFYATYFFCFSDVSDKGGRRVRVVRALGGALRRQPRCSAPSTRAGRSFWGLARPTLAISILYSSQLFMLSLPSHK